MPMDAPTARRIILAFMAQEQFDFIAEINENVADNSHIKEGFGFSLSEIETARADRRSIAAEYARLKGRQSFWAAEIAAKLGWLTASGPDNGASPDGQAQ